MLSPAAQERASLRRAPGSGFRDPRCSHSLSFGFCPGAFLDKVGLLCYNANSVAVIEISKEWDFGCYVCRR